MKDPKLGISDKYITFFFSISKKLTKTSKLLITSDVKTMRYVWKPGAHQMEPPSPLIS